MYRCQEAYSITVSKKSTILLFKKCADVFKKFSVIIFNLLSLHIYYIMQEVHNNIQEVRSIMQEVRSYIQEVSNTMQEVRSII